MKKPISKKKPITLPGMTPLKKPIRPLIEEPKPVPTKPSSIFGKTPDSKKRRIGFGN